MALFVATLITGAMGQPAGEPRPVVKTTICAPPATIAVTDSGSLPGVSITTRPRRVGRCA